MVLPRIPSTHPSFVRPATLLSGAHEKIPEVGVGGGRKRLNVLGAYCPDDMEYLDRRYTDKNLNAQSVIELFASMMSKHPET